MQADLLDGVGDLLGLLEQAVVLSLCLDGERLGEIRCCVVLEGDDDLLVIGDLESLELSG